MCIADTLSGLLQALVNLFLKLCYAGRPVFSLSNPNSLRNCIHTRHQEMQFESVFKQAKLHRQHTWCAFSCTPSQSVIFLRPIHYTKYTPYLDMQWLCFCFEFMDDQVATGWLLGGAETCSLGYLWMFTKLHDGLSSTKIGIFTSRI